MISKTNEDATFEAIRNRDNDCARKATIGSAACYGQVGATPLEQMTFVWNMATRYANTELTRLTAERDTALSKVAAMDAAIERVEHRFASVWKDIMPGLYGDGWLDGLDALKAELAKPPAALTAPDEGECEHPQSRVRMNGICMDCEQQVRPYDCDCGICNYCNGRPSQDAPTGGQ